jgi:UDP-perosamine 4-acetyltransferase
MKLKLGRHTTMHLIIFGAGGHAKVVLDAARQSGIFSAFSFVDPHCNAEQFGGFPIIRDAAALKSARHFVVAIGDNELRRRNYEAALAQGLVPINVVHPRAIIAPDVEIGDGTVVFAGAVINAASQIGANCIINTGAIIEHDCKIANHTHIAPGSKIAGGVSVGENALIGIGATVIPGIKIGASATVAAGAVVTHDVESGSTVYGVPAKAKSLK